MKLHALTDRDTGVSYIGQVSDDTFRGLPLEEFWERPRAHLHGWDSATETMSHHGLTPHHGLLGSARVICLGLNYRDHVGEGRYADVEYPSVPTIFGRWSKSIAPAGSRISVPIGEAGLDWEGEVAAWLTVEDGKADVLGYSVFNDLSARSAQRATSQWTIGKNVDGSGILGPLVTADECGNMGEGWDLETKVNGHVVQHGNTRDVIYDLATVIEYLSKYMSLSTGDLIVTGTPAGVGIAMDPPRLLNAGDVVTVEVEGLGRISTELA